LGEAKQGSFTGQVMIGLIVLTECKPAQGKYGRMCGRFSPRVNGFTHVAQHVGGRVNEAESAGGGR
jgi:hypothetical protein